MAGYVSSRTGKRHCDSLAEARCLQGHRAKSQDTAGGVTLPTRTAQSLPNEMIITRLARKPAWPDRPAFRRAYKLARLNWPLVWPSWQVAVYGVIIQIKYVLTGRCLQLKEPAGARHNATRDGARRALTTATRHLQSQRDDDDDGDCDGPTTLRGLPASQPN